MSVKFSINVRNARLDSIESVVGASPKLQLRTGAQPSNCGSANIGILLATIDLPADWMAAASGGSKSISGTWEGSGIADGIVGHYRLFNNAETVCHEQGTVMLDGSGGDLTLDNTDVKTGQIISISTWTKTDANA